MVSLYKNFLHSDNGATALEYALMLSLIAIAIIASVRALGIELKVPFEKVTTGIEAANQSGAT